MHLKKWPGEEEAGQEGSWTSPLPPGLLCGWLSTLEHSILRSKVETTKSCTLFLEPTVN